MVEKRFVSMALIALATLTLAGGAFAQQKSADASAAKPKITLVEPVKDFGTVPKGQMLDWSFVIKNTGTADLEIKSANPTCGCTVADFDKLIKPGQSGKITAHVDTTNFSGPISKAVTIQSNDPETPAAQVSIAATVKPYVEAYPAGFVRYTLLQGEEQTQSVTLYSEDEAPFEILSVTTPGEWVKVKHSKIALDSERIKAGRAGQNQYKVDVTVGGSTTPVGPLTDKIVFKTNSKFQPEYRLSLSGVVRPTYIVAPSVVNFGEVSTEMGQAERVITVQSNNRAQMDAFKVSKVESNIPGITAEAKSTDQAGIFEVSVKVVKGTKPGEFDGKLKIFTSDPIKPTTEIPVRGMVK
ncbi:MAG: DUF1573 domain-containing protein [Thermoanaerobaculia bacterium]|nr:DUF1573 domain-containing protein [Thermoanaerobaculia bacterium]